VSTVTVELAGPADAATAADVQLQVWRDGYGDVLPQEVLAELAEHRAEHERAWARRITQGGPVLLAREGHEVVGVAGVAAVPDPDGTGEVDVLAVVPRWGRRGHGGRLLAAAAEQLRGTGARTGCCWVVDGNAATAGLLRAAGWQPDGGARTLDTGARPLAEVRWSGTLDLAVVERG
jgi:GNAT superfamily N-acetyltransferase